MYGAAVAQQAERSEGQWFDISPSSLSLGKILYTKLIPIAAPSVCEWFWLLMSVEASATTV